MVEYVNACKMIKEYANDLKIKYDRVAVLEYDERWIFQFIPNSKKCINPPMFSLYKNGGHIAHTQIVVPPFENLELIKKGKKLEFIY